MASQFRANALWVSNFSEELCLSELVHWTNTRIFYYKIFNNMWKLFIWHDRIQTKVPYITRQFINQDTESMELLTKKIKQIQYKFLNQIFFPIMMMYILRIYYTVLRRQLKMIFLSVHLIFIVIICRFCLYLRIKD